MTLESTQLAEALRSAATIDALRANPFRLANARVDSTSRELNRALNTLKVKVELGDEPGHTFAPDTADADMVRQAAERVKDPVKRLADECFWFWPLEAGEKDAALDSFEAGNPMEPISIWQQMSPHGTWGPIAKHNLGLVSLLDAMEKTEAFLRRSPQAPRPETLGAAWIEMANNFDELTDSFPVEDYLRADVLAQGLVDETKMGVLGWSAGGHWSNWILTHTDRFKGISSGAGTSNWISMYAQSDVQRNRQYYLGNKLPYDDFDAYWKQSPIKYIRNAKTPTMIHVVEGDPRVPSPQSVELHMGLKRVGVPTELFMYPGASHGIPDARNRLVKSAAEMAWMNYWVLGNGKKFSWREVLETLEDPKAEKKVEVKGIN